MRLMALAGSPPPRTAGISVSYLRRRPQPLTFEIPEMVDCAWLSAELTDEVPVIAGWIAVQTAWDTFG